MKVKANKLKPGDLIDLGNGKTAEIKGKVIKMVEIPARKQKIVTLSVDVRSTGPVPTAGFDQYVAFGDQDYKIIVEKSSRVTRFKAWASGFIPWRKKDE